MTRHSLLFGIPLFTAQLLCQTPAAWTPELSMRVNTIGQVVPSNDGEWVAYTQTRAVMEAEVSELRSQVFLARSDGSRQVQLTRGGESSTAPSFSPDSRFVYFLSGRAAEEDRRNIWRIPVDGGEAERLGEWDGKLGTYQVSPDGKWIAFTGRRTGAEREKAKSEKRDFRVIDEDPANQTLWILSAGAASSDERQPKQVFEATYHIAEFDWSPDSRSIVFQYHPTGAADDWTKADLSEVQVENGAVKSLAGSPAAENSPRYSPDGEWVAYLRHPDPVRWARECRFVLLRRESGEKRELPVTEDECGRGTNLLGWAPDSKALYFTETNGTQNLLKIMPTDGSVTELYRPLSGTLSSYGGSARLSDSGTHLGFAQESSGRPVEAFVLSVSGGFPREVSRANRDLVMPPLGETKTVRWKSKDGLEIEGLLTYPVGYKSGEEYPLALVIHGGPMGVFTQTFLGNRGLYPLAALASSGYAILRPNPRGSSGYGKQFRFGNYDDWGGGDYEDIMAGVDHVIALGVADPNRLAVMGWSYGGYMTAWVITHTGRFKAAAAGAAVTNLRSFTGTADIPGFLPDYFSGESWENAELYRKHSPMSHVKGATTPTLILHGEADLRVPVSQSYELYNALKRQGVTTKMVVYPRQPHGPREPKFLLDIAQRHLDWVEKYVK